MAYQISDISSADAAVEQSVTTLTEILQYIFNIKVPTVVSWV